MEMKWTEVITAIVAVLAFIMSGFGLIRDIFRNKIRLKVKLDRMYRCNVDNTVTILLVWKAQNSGNKNITLRATGLKLKEMKLFNSFKYFPYFKLDHIVLQPGDSISQECVENDLIESLIADRYKGKIKLDAYYVDQLDKRFISNSIGINLSKNAK